MKIINHGFVREVAETKEGIIYQSNYRSIEEITFSYYHKDYEDELNIYSGSDYTIAKFTVKSKLPF